MFGNTKRIKDLENDLEKELQKLNSLIKRSIKDSAFDQSTAEENRERIEKLEKRVKENEYCIKRQKKTIDTIMDKHDTIEIFGEVNKRKLTPRQEKIYTTLVINSDDKGIIHIDNNRLCRITEIPMSTAVHAIHKLRKLGLIQVYGNGKQRVIRVINKNHEPTLP